MRINSSQSIKFLRFLYLLCILSIIIDLILLNIDGSWKSIIGFSPISIVVIIILIYRGLPMFMYDSDGEVLNFDAREPNLLGFSRLFQKHFEFPKRKLVGFKIKNILLRRVLIVYISSKDGTRKKETMTISYLKRRELKDLHKSLSGVLNENKAKNK